MTGAFGVAILARGAKLRRPFDFQMVDRPFVTREVLCGKCANHCEVICVYRDKDIIDSWGNRCDKGAVKTTA